MLEGWWRFLKEGVAESQRPGKQTDSEGEEQYVRIGPPNPDSHRPEYGREFPLILKVPSALEVAPKPPLYSESTVLRKLIVYWCVTSSYSKRWPQRVGLGCLHCSSSDAYLQ